MRLVWAPLVKRQNFLKLRNADIQPIMVEGAILLQLQISNLRIRVWFGVDEGLTVDLLLCTPFIDRYVQGIFLAERMLVQ